MAAKLNESYGAPVRWQPTTPRVRPLHLVVSWALAAVAVYIAAALVAGFESDHESPTCLVDLESRHQSGGDIDGDGCERPGDNQVKRAQPRRRRLPPDWRSVGLVELGGHAANLARDHLLRLAGSGAEQ